MKLSEKLINSRYANGNDLPLNILWRIALFGNFEFITSIGKYAADISHAYIDSSRYKLLSSAEFIDDLSIGFHWDCVRRQKEFTCNKNINGRTNVRKILNDVSGSAEHHGKATYGHGWKLTLTRN